MAKGQACRQMRAKAPAPGLGACAHHLQLAAGQAAGRVDVGEQALESGELRRVPRPATPAVVRLPREGRYTVPSDSTCHRGDRRHVPRRCAPSPLRNRAVLPRIRGRGRRIPAKPPTRLGDRPGAGTPPPRTRSPPLVLPGAKSHGNAGPARGFSPVPAQLATPCRSCAPTPPLLWDCRRRARRSFLGGRRARRRRGRRFLHPRRPHPLGSRTVPGQGIGLHPGHGLHRLDNALFVP